ncbi:toxin-antitoxin system HicB family antitoxin [Kutzneria sp. CA-103260]|uniref:toxin-antitoxin system HicB family antitoxin n=1 Tax=Kutzneria sp. CA-103260 TaxID=2802641 RepID=UPI001BA98370|nr:toxin-antitoxin system HicB family antitoxin [Kutzneria sp. CA-103260]QUQ71631.1 HicB family protein [Kutzneria sp. CA-103260]
MDLTPYIATLREDLTTAAAAGDDQTRRTAAVLSAALEPAVRLAIMNALSDLAAEVTASLDDHVVSLRLDGRDVQVVVTATAPSDEPGADEEEPAAAFVGDPQGDISRITVRLIEELKAKAEQAAAAQGQSLNAFVSQAVQGALNNQRRGGHGRGRNRGGQWWDGNQNWGGRGGDRGWPGWNDQGGPGQGGSGQGRGGGHGGSRVSGWVEG